MRTIWTRVLLLVTLTFSASLAMAQLPNEKFGKPSSMEWDFVGWGDAIGADAIILYKSMTATYQLTDQVSNNTQSSDFGIDNLQDFGKNQIDEGNILVNYQFKLRTKILKPEGAKHANIDITYYSLNDDKFISADELSDLKIKVFSKNEKGKVVKRSINTSNFVKERVDDNYMVLHVEVPDVEAGSIIEYQYNITSTRAAFLYDWVFQESIPTVRSMFDLDVPAFLQFNMNVPINKLIKPSVTAGHLNYDTNRQDLKRGKSCPTNHYVVVGDYILPEGHPMKRNADGQGDEKAEKIAVFTSLITTPNVPHPAAMPEGCTHLRIK